MAFLAIAVATSVVGLAGCKSNAKMPVTFVAVTSDTYNAEISIGNYSYKFKGTVDQKSNKFLLAGTVQKRVSASGGQGGQGGPGGPGGGMGGFNFGGGGQQGGQQGGGQQQKPAPTSLSLSLDKTSIFIDEQVEAKVVVPEGSDDSVDWATSDENIATVSSGKITGVAEGKATITATSKKDATKTASVEITVNKEDLAAHNWSVSGTYVLEKGYGYVISFNDQWNSVIHADFDKVEGRHEFYYNVNIENKSSIVKFQAKDPTFKNTLAKDYKKWDERDSKYIFMAKATGNNGSLATAYLYLHKDGSAVINAPQNRGVDRDLTFGLTWEEANGSITLKNGNKTYQSKASVNAEHPGFWIDYEGYSFLYSAKEDVKWKKMTVADFEGATSYEFTGSYTTSGPDGGDKEMLLNLYTADHVAKLYQGSWTPSIVGTWAENDGVLTFNYKVTEGQGPAAQEVDKVLTSEKDDNGVFFTYVIVQSSWGETVETPVRLSSSKK